MSRLAELRNRARELAERIRALAENYNQRRRQRDAADSDEARSAIELWPEAERREWKEVNAEYDRVKAEIEQEERDAQVVARQAEADDWLRRSTADPNNRPGLDDQLPGGSNQTYGDLGLRDRDEATQLLRRERDLVLAFQAYAAYGVPNARLTDAHRDACDRLQFSPAQSHLELRMLDTDTYRGMQRRLRAAHPDSRQSVINELLELRAMSSHLGTSGGYLTVPASVVNMVEIAMIQFGRMLEVADTITTETGEDMGWPVADDTSNEASYTDENPTTAPSDVEPGFEQVVWRSHDLQSGFIKVPFKLFRDSFANIEMLISRLIGERFGRKLSGECTTGVAKIRGIIPRSPVGETTAGSTAITYADVVDLDTSLDPAHAAGAAYMFHNNILGALRKLVDSQNRPLWISNIAAGVPDTFNGKRYFLNQKMASTITSGDKTMITGDFSYYKVRRVGQMRLRRLVERFAEFDQTAFIGYISADGNLLRPNASAASPVQVMQQA